MYNIQLQKVVQTLSLMLLLCLRDIGPRCTNKLFNTVSVSGSNHFTTICHTARTREALTEHRKSGDLSSSSVKLSGYTANVLISQVTRGPSSSVVSSRSKRDEDIELASTRDFRSSIGRGIEVEGTRLTLGLRQEFESKEGSNVGRATVLEDLAVTLVIVYSAGLDVIQRGRYRSDNRNFLQAFGQVLRFDR